MLLYRCLLEVWPRGIIRQQILTVVSCCWNYIFCGLQTYWTYVCRTVVTVFSQTLDFTHFNYLKHNLPFTLWHSFSSSCEYLILQKGNDRSLKCNKHKHLSRLTCALHTTATASRAKDSSVKKPCTLRYWAFKNEESGCVQCQDFIRNAFKERVFIWK